MACVDRVAKNGVNQSQNYNYAQASDVYDAVRSELAKRFILPCPNPTQWDFVERDTQRGGKLVICTVRGTLDFIDAETGETMSRPMLGQGSDSLDKASYKAMTGAMKNAIVHQFLIPTGDDPENEKPRKPEPPPPAGLEALKNRSRLAPAAQSSGATFPNYGNLKGQSVRGAPMKDLEFYANGAKRTLADPQKSRFHGAERLLLSAIEAEILRQKAGPVAAATAVMPPDDDQGPPF